MSRLPTCSNLQIEKTYLNTNGLFEPINNTQYYLSPPSDIFHSNEPSPNQNLNNFVNHRLVNVKYNNASHQNMYDEKFTWNETNICIDEEPLYEKRPESIYQNFKNRDDLFHENQKVFSPSLENQMCYRDSSLSFSLQDNMLSKKQEYPTFSKENNLPCYQGRILVLPHESDASFKHVDSIPLHNNDILCQLVDQPILHQDNSSNKYNLEPISSQAINLSYKYNLTLLISQQNDLYSHLQHSSSLHEDETISKEEEYLNCNRENDVSFKEEEEEEVLHYLQKDNVSIADTVIYLKKNKPLMAQEEEVLLLAHEDDVQFIENVDLLLSPKDEITPFEQHVDLLLSQKHVTPLEQGLDLVLQKDEIQHEQKVDSFLLHKDSKPFQQNVNILLSQKDDIATEQSVDLIFLGEGDASFEQPTKLPPQQNDVTSFQHSIDILPSQKNDLCFKQHVKRLLSHNNKQHMDLTFSHEDDSICN